jgi:hypothetical protein
MLECRLSPIADIRAQNVALASPRSARPPVTPIALRDFARGGKWLELLKEAAPRIERVALINNAQLVPGDGGYGYFPTIEDAARVLAVKTTKVPYRNAVDIVRAIDAFSAEPNGGLIVLPPPPTAEIPVSALLTPETWSLPPIRERSRPWCWPSRRRSCLRCRRRHRPRCEQR